VAAVGERLKEERLLRGWSQRDLAREAGTTAETISSIETGQHEPRPSTLRKLAEGLGIEVRDFFAEPSVPLAEAPRGAGRPSVIDIALDAARRQVALEAEPQEGDMLDQRYANEAMIRLHEEYSLSGDDAEAVRDFALKYVELEKENDRLHEELQQQEAARQQ
jgi:transcriptional regulator with XRE-family HTH domain